MNIPIVELLLLFQVSQNWFGEEERGLATLLLAMSNPLGLVLGQLVMIMIIDCYLVDDVAMSDPLGLVIGQLVMMIIDCKLLLFG